MKTILAQEDCAPDAMQLFEKDFKKETGMTVIEFQKKAAYTDDFMLKWELNGYTLSIAPDDPYYRLDKSN